MSLDQLHDELVSLIFQQLLYHKDSNSFRALASTCHRMNWLSKNLIPADWTPTVYCTKYRRCASNPDLKELAKRYWLLREQFHAFLKDQQLPFPAITSEDFTKFGHYFPFFWLRLISLKYLRVHKIAFVNCKLNDTRPFNHIQSISQSNPLAKDNLQSITTIELSNIFILTLRWLDQMLFLFKRLKNLSICDTRVVVDGTISSDQTREIIRTREPSSIKLETLKLIVSYIGDNFMEYFTSICPAKIFVHNCNQSKMTYDDLKLYLTASTTKEFVTCGSFYRQASEDSSLQNIKIKHYSDCKHCSP